MADTDLSGTVLDGRYQVIEPIAEGAMGSVYRGERLKLGRAVAIKIMHQELPDELASRQRFEREAKLMALLEHPNCVSVMDFGVHEDKPFLVMDLVRGTSLLELLDKTKRFEPTRAIDIVRQVLSGLAHAHELGIVHRDIKPANIMITEKAGLGSQVRILDFGLARLTESSTKLTTGIVVGTPNYMAPEQCKGSDVDARTDLYACGVLLFEMLTGRKPFVADDPIAVVRKHLLEKPPTLSSVEPNVHFGQQLEDIIAKALAKAPADRFDSAVDMSKALEAAARMTAAAVYARAVPDSKAPPIANQQATMSGWTVPQGGGPPPGPGAASPPIAPPAAAPPPVAPSAPPPAAESSYAPPVTESQFVDTIAPPPGSPLAPPRAAPADSSYAPPVTESQFVDAIVPPPGSPLAPAGAPHASAPSAPHASAPSAPHASAAPAAPLAASASASIPSDGAPNRSLAVPPTRPAQPRALGQLPFTRKQMLIAGGGLLGVILLIAIIAGGGSHKKGTAKTTPDKPVLVTPPPSDDAIAQVIQRGNQLIAEDDPEEAVAVLSKARKTSPDNAQLALALGRAYFAKLWWSEGVRNFRDAIQLDPELRSDPEMLKALLKGFLTTPDVDDRITDFMLEIGDPMKAYLKETADTHPNKQLRARAKNELRRYK
ncbi:MAG TPA: protein kinase [Kofleriaceae bacterium]|nr:protein kinase [Kofleriaceae bacterium]